MVEMRAARAAPSRPESKGADRGQSGSWKDSDTLALLWDALHRECSFDPSSCDLEVRDHVVYVRGSVESLAQKRAIARAATSVPGVRGIVNDLRIAPLSHRSDHRIAGEIRAALGKSGLSAPLPDIKVLDGVVYLSGTVGSLDARKSAEDAAWSVPGVEYVVNDVKTAVAPPCSRRAGEMERTLQDVQFAVERSLGAESANVEVTLMGDIVRLRGQVSSERQKFLTEDAVRWVPCVVDVVNELTAISSSAN